MDKIDKIDNITKLREIGWDCIRAANYLRYVRRQNEINKEHIERYNESLKNKSSKSKKTKNNQIAELQKEIDKLKSLLKSKGI